MRLALKELYRSRACDRASDRRGADDEGVGSSKQSHQQIHADHGGSAHEGYEERPHLHSVNAAAAEPARPTLIAVRRTERGDHRSQTGQQEG